MVRPVEDDVAETVGLSGDRTGAIQRNPAVPLIVVRLRRCPGGVGCEKTGLPRYDAEEGAE